MVVGAGPTGVELAGALGEIARDTLKNEFRSIRPEEARILLLDGSDRVLPPYPPDLSRKAEQHLIDLGVRPRSKVRVTGIDENGVTLKTETGEEHIASKTVIWAAGVTASPFGKVLANRCGAKQARTGSVLVEPDLSVPGHPEIFVIGDLAHLEQDGSPCPEWLPSQCRRGSTSRKQFARGSRIRAYGRFTISTRKPCGDRPCRCGCRVSASFT